MADWASYGCSGVVAKPYTIVQLQEALHNVLKDRQASASRRPFVEEFRTFCLSCPSVKDTVWGMGDTLQELLGTA
jgi:hypothetical protein